MQSTREAPVSPQPDIRLEVDNELELGNEVDIFYQFRR
jgi:hypothetical protein